MEIVVCALSITIYKICAIKKKIEMFDLENEGQGREGENCDFQLIMFDSILVIFFTF